MRFLRHIKILSIFSVVLLAGIACDSDSSSDNGNMATLEGRVESDTQAKAVNADMHTVMAASIDANGNISAINGTETQTNASGEFQLMVDASQSQNIVVMVEGEAQTMYTMTTDEIENGRTYMLKPVDAESSAEVRVMAELMESGEAENVFVSDIEAVINSDVSSEVNSDSNVASDLAASLATAAEVRVSYMEEEFENEAQDRLNNIRVAMNEAQIELENSLYASGSVEAREDAYAVYNEAMLDAYMNADVDATTTAKLFDMWGRVIVEQSNSLSSEAETVLNKQISLYTATVLDIGVQAEAEAADVEEATMSAIVDAGVELKSAVDASAATVAEIETAFETYHNNVRTALEDDTNFNSEIVIAIDTEINSNTGAKSSFESSFTASLSADLFVDVYTEFFTAINNAVDTMSQDQTEAQIEVLTDLMILINTAS